MRQQAPAETFTCTIPFTHADPGHLLLAHQENSLQQREVSRQGRHGVMTKTAFAASKGQTLNYFTLDFLEHHVREYYIINFPTSQKLSLSDSQAGYKYVLEQNHS